MRLMSHKVVRICELCKIHYQFIILHRDGNQRKFCDECIQRKKQLHYLETKQYRKTKRAIGESITGRPIKEEEKTYGKDDARFAWDEPLECGGLI